MTKISFRVLGTAHGIAGLFTFALVVYLFIKVGGTSFGPGPLFVKAIGAIGGAVIISCLVATMVATWQHPAWAPLFAWLAAIAYVAVPLVGGLLLYGPNLFSQLDPHFYLSSAVRLIAALALTLMSKRLV